MNLTDTSLKKRERWTINTWKKCSISSIITKCKSKLQWGITSYKSEWQSSKNLQAINAGEEAEKREPSCTIGRNVSWSSYYGEQYRDSLKTRNKTAIWPNNTTIGQKPWKKKSEVAQSCLTLGDLMDCSLPGSSVHGSFQARILEGDAISFSRGSSGPRGQPQVFCNAGRLFTV